MELVATDAALAVRPGNEYFRSIKPAAKLVNAWQAGCPALLGPEAGYANSAGVSWTIWKCAQWRMRLQP